jgi:hypothetical protein
MKNNSTHGGALSLVILVIVALITLSACQSFAQGANTNSVPMTIANANPVYSISNMFQINNGGILTSDPIVPGTFDYTQGTNHAGAQILPAGVSKSRYVSFGFQVATTNTVACTYVATVQGSTGYGDWVSLSPVLPVTTTSTYSVGASWATNSTTFSTNTTYDTGGLVLFRVKNAVDPEAATTNAQVTVSFSCKPGI